MSRGGHVQCCSNERPYFLLQERPSPSVRCWFPQLGWTWASLTGIFWPEARISKIHEVDKLVTNNSRVLLFKCVWSADQRATWAVDVGTRYNYLHHRSQFNILFSSSSLALQLLVWQKKARLTHTNTFLCLCLAVKIVAGQWILAPYWLQTPLNRTRHWSRASVSSCREKNWPEVQNAVVFVRRRKAHSLHIN